MEGGDSNHKWYVKRNICRQTSVRAAVWLEVRKIGHTELCETMGHLMKKITPELTPFLTPELRP